ESAPVFDGLAQGEELFWTQGDGDGLSRQLAGPLVAGARGPESGTIQHGALADITDMGQGGAQAAVLMGQGIRRDGLVFHGVILRWRSSLYKYRYLLCPHLSSPPGAPAWPLWAGASNTSANKACSNWTGSSTPSCPRDFSPRPGKAPTAGNESIHSGAPSSGSCPRSSTRIAPAGKSCARFWPWVPWPAARLPARAPAPIGKPGNACPGTCCPGCAAPWPPAPTGRANSGTVCASKSPMAPA